MIELRLTESARLELVELWAYLADEAGESVADGQMDRLFASLETLQQFPEIGRLRPELRPAVRSYLVKPWVIFYRHDTKALTILHAVHGSRDLPRLFE